LSGFEWLSDLPRPVDDGRCDHLAGAALPDLSLPSTAGGERRLSLLQGTCVFYLYPMTGKPGVSLPAGWLEIPGAAGCTPQSCGYRDSFDAFRSRGCSVFGISTQSTNDQIEAAVRLQLPYELLSDERLALVDALDLPTFVVQGTRMIMRQTWIVKGGRIAKVFYPVFPPHQNAADVLGWLNANP
jgi:peroxiredoxin